MRIISEPKELIGRYVAMKIGRTNDWEKAVMFGLLNDDDVLVAGVVFNGYVKPSITMSIAADHLTPAFIAAVMRYAFIQCGCERITSFVEKKNKASRELAVHWGGKLEGCMRKASLKGDVMIYGMLRSEAEKWLSERYREKLEKVL